MPVPFAFASALPANVRTWSGRNTAARCLCAVSRGPTTPPPDYSATDINAANRLFTSIFTRKLEGELGREAEREGFAGVIEVVRALAVQYEGDVEGLRAASERVLVSLFPRWLPPAFCAMFSRPFPAFAVWINAMTTVAVTQWLMGSSKLSDEDGTTVEIQRCRYLEETGCVGICLNSCKAATESFFHANMGLDLYIEPNLEDFSCQFHFGTSPPPPEEDPMYEEPCLQGCPMANARHAQPMRVCNTIKERERDAFE